MKDNDVFGVTFPEEMQTDPNMPVDPDAPVTEEDLDNWSTNGFFLPGPSPTPVINAIVINQAYEGLKSAVMHKQGVNQDLLNQQNNLSRFKEVLEFHKQEAILSGKNVGKNVEQREAFSRQLFFDEYEHLAKLEQKHVQMTLTDNHANMVVRLWQIECERVSKLMDLLTLELTEQIKAE